MTVPEKFSKPQFFGPGLWFSIHTFAADATTQEKKKAFIDYMYLITALLKCADCRKHATQYISEHPPEDMPLEMDKDDVDVTMFKWSFDFHNTVNRRLAKKEMSWEEAYELFLSPNAAVCEDDCGEMTVTSIHERPLPFVAEKAKKAFNIQETKIQKNSQWSKTSSPNGLLDQLNGHVPTKKTQKTTKVVGGFRLVPKH
jgi:hypothetical protein